MPASECFVKIELCSSLESGDGIILITVKLRRPRLISEMGPEWPFLASAWLQVSFERDSNMENEK